MSITSNLGLSEPTHHFNAILAKELIKDDVDKGIIFSPLSVSFALALTAIGSQGQTQQEMISSLQLSGMKPEIYRTFIENLQKNHNATINLANAIFTIGPNTVMKQTFLDAAQKHFHSGVQSVKSADEVNDWVSKETHGKIQKLLQEFKGDDAAVLVNAIYFKADWAKKFDGKLTTQQDFYKLDGTTLKCHLMKSSTEKRPYYAGSSFTAVQLPYEKRFKAIAILPNKEGNLTSSTKTGIEAAFNELNSMSCDEFLNKFGSQRSGTVWLPRFKIEYKKSLKETMKKLGMQFAFGSDADFSPMTEESGWHISDIIHQALIEVNEKGSEAAAATAVVLARSMAVHRPDPPFEFRADRSFIFQIVDFDEKVVLFTAIVNEFDPLNSFQP
eukprot:TRINITY_DN10571_c0_g1_i1.p1 TRINITY_DN10571_c0_g1~~TRINITY_DN10571_c0_g1_i1.p1  ORF type:complete len:386 (-),score=110.29 TRINITY_DN10571_c0_g1_i1:15-1172(-)